MDPELIDLVGEDAPGPVDIVTLPDIYPPETIEEVVSDEGPPMPAIEVVWGWNPLPKMGLELKLWLMQVTDL